MEADVRVTPKRWSCGMLGARRTILVAALRRRLNRRGGGPCGVAFVALDQLGHAFAAMATALRTEGASDDDCIRFQNVIVKAINEAHGLDLAERLAALTTLFPAFDRNPRHMPMKVIRADFRRQVRLTAWNDPPPLRSDGFGPAASSSSRQP